MREGGPKSPTLHEQIPENLAYRLISLHLFAVTFQLKHTSKAHGLIRSYFGIWSDTLSDIPELLDRSINVVVFSKDRAFQLEGTLASFFARCKDHELAKVYVLYRTTSPHIAAQYESLKFSYPSVTFVEEISFKQQLHALMLSRYILFLVDDNIFVRDFSLFNTIRGLEHFPTAIGFSLRLGFNTTYCYPLNKNQEIPKLAEIYISETDRIFCYSWTSGEHDFKYPLEVSSSIYRCANLRPVLELLDYNHPNSLEAKLAEKISEAEKSHPLLLTFEKSVTFCNPVNKVQVVAPDNRAGDQFHYSVETLSQWFDDGQRLDVDSYLGYTPKACHEEVPLRTRDLSSAKKTEIYVTPNTLVSVVIPCYKQAHFLEESVDSVVSQSYQAWELIIVNDGSPDNTSEVANALIAKYPERQIRLIEKENEGLAEARNTAIAEANGEWIACLDSDDKFAPNYLARLLQEAASDASINHVCSYLNEFDARQNTLMVVPYERQGLLMNNMFPYCSLYKRALWVAAGGYMPIIPFGAEDWNFWVSCIDQINPRLVREPLFFYRKHQNSSMVDGVLKHQDLVNSCLYTIHPQHHRFETLLGAHACIASMDLETRNAIERLIDKFPQYGQPYFWRALNEHAQGHWRKALRDYRMAAQLMPKHDWQALTREVQLLQQINAHTEAAEVAQRALNQFPTLPFRNEFQQVISAGVETSARV